MSKMGKFFAVTAATLAATAVYAKKRKTEDPTNPEVNLTNETKKRICACYTAAVRKSTEDLTKRKNELGLPGVVIGVSVDGKLVWAQGFGMANVETQTPCTVSTKMRIASISKPITTSLLAKLMESGEVDLDKPVQDYVSYFPQKVFNGKGVTLTARQLASHKGGIRHYKAMEGSEGDGGPEFYLTQRFKTVAESVALFSQDELLCTPGDEYNYTTHGFTLLSAVIEGAANTPFDKLLRSHIASLGLTNTHLDEISPLVYNRASYYSRNSKGHLVNAELTDTSYKWAGGGLVSDVSDLLKFANIMLYSYQQQTDAKAGFLAQRTVAELWSPVAGTNTSWSPHGGYGLGWVVVPRKEGWLPGQLLSRHHIGHSGGAVGASSVLLVFPLTPAADGIPSGVSVAIITNMQSAGLYKVAYQIAERFIAARQAHRASSSSPSPIKRPAQRWGVTSDRILEFASVSCQGPQAGSPSSPDWSAPAP